MLRPNLCDYSDAYIVVKGAIDLGVAWNNNMTDVLFKNNASFSSCISKINNIFIQNAQILIMSY